MVGCHQFFIGRNDPTEGTRPAGATGSGDLPRKRRRSNDLQCLFHAFHKARPVPRHTESLRKVAPTRVGIIAVHLRGAFAMHAAEIANAFACIT